MGGVARGPAAGERILRRVAPGHGSGSAGSRGVYAGTNSGTLFASADEGEHWTTIAQHLPPILSAETLVVEA